MSVITRFAPSPTGYLHIGNIRTALMCYVFAKKHRGQFMLRLDDTDTERSQEEYTQQIQADLTWLGFQWDKFARQSERLRRYQEVIGKLIADGRLYPCYETAEEIEIKRKIQLNRKQPPIYDREALKLTDAQKASFEKEGRPKHWRFKLDETQTIQWHDLIKGSIHFEACYLSDPVLIRANGAPTYMLPSAIDDLDFAITHVVRGEDHVTNTAIQIQLFEAMGGKAPAFAHHSLMKSKDGKISKRDGGYDIRSLKKEGIETMAICSLMAKIGTSDAIEPCTDMDHLVEHFDLSKFGHAAAIYDKQELLRLNAKIIHRFSYEDVKHRDELRHIDKNFWDSVHGNLENLPEIKQWWDLCHGTIRPVIAEKDRDFIASALEHLPADPWDETTWGHWVDHLKKITGRRGKELFMPLRLALTALDHGPELKYLLPLIGHSKAKERLSFCQASS